MSDRFSLVLTSLIAISAYFGSTSETFAQSSTAVVSDFVEPFETLNSWQHVALPNVRSTAKFQLTPKPTGQGKSPKSLHLESDSGASILIFSKLLNVTQRSVLRWNWQVLKSPSTADPSKKSGDDYAIRIYLVASSKNPALSVWDRM